MTSTGNLRTLEGNSLSPPSLYILDFFPRKRWAVNRLFQLCVTSLLHEFKKKNLYFMLAYSSFGKPLHYSVLNSRSLLLVSQDAFL